jgi:hypothetical protein
LYFRLAFSTLVLAAAAVPAHASISYYSTLSAFDAATSGMTQQAVSFDSALGTGFFNSITLNTITFTGSGPYSNVSGELTVLNNPGVNWPTGTVLAHSTSGAFSGGQISVTFPAAVTAFAFYTGYVNAFNNLDVTVNTATSFNDQNPYLCCTIGQANFFGFVTTEAITNLLITAPANYGEQIQLGGFVFDTSPGSSTPELSTVFLAGTGLAALGLWKRKRKAPSA